jgi:transcription elongation GreA/GreB family factor
MHKKTVVAFLTTQLKNQIAQIRLQIENLSQDASENAKSSAGDKHETDLAMVHLEQEQLSKKLSQLLDNLQTWQQIDFGSSASTVKQGSLVKTNLGWLLISIALPQYKIENETVISISPQSPLGQLLIGKQPNERFELNQKTFEVQEIL